MGAFRMVSACVRTRLWSSEMTELPDEDRFLTPPEASAFLRRGVRTLARMRAEGRGPSYHRQGGKILYPLSSLRTWIREGLVVPVGGRL